MDASSRSSTQLLDLSSEQGDPISPTTFISYLKRVMDTVRDNGTGVSVHGHTINNLKFADDIDLLEEDRDELQGNLERINKAGEAAGGCRSILKRQ